MRDIIYRPVRPHQAKPAPAHEPQPVALPVIPPPSRLSTFFHSLNIVGGSIATMFDGKKNTQSSVIITPKKSKLPKKPFRTASHRVAAGSRIVYEKTRSTATTARAHIKTPIGKLATINALVFLMLFGYIYQQGKTPATTQATRNAGTALNNTVERYLPVVASAPEEAPFKEADVATTSQHTKLHVWVTPWNTAEVLQTKTVYSSFSAFWGTVDADGSTITPKSNLSDWHTFASNVTSTQPTFLTISGNPSSTYITLTTPSAQQAFISNALTLLKENNFSGIDIDFEGLGIDNKDSFTSFIRNLATALHAEGKQVAVTVESRIANQVPMDWHNLGLIADQVRIMVYDYHSRLTNQPGPISPLGWLKEVADYATTTIDPKKVIIGLGNYGYDWSAPENTEDSWQGTGLSYETALGLSKNYNSPVLHTTGIDPRGYDIGTAAYFHYQDEQGKEHEVWFEDATSLQEKINLLDQYTLAGVIFWSVGLGDQLFWTQ